MKYLILVSILAVTSAALANPVGTEEQSLALIEPRQADVFGTYRKLIENLVRDLRAAAKDAADAFGKFSEGLANLGRQYRDRISREIQSLRDKVSGALKELTERFTSTGSAVRTCIESRRDEAASIFNDTVTNSMACANQRIEEISGLLSNLDAISSRASRLASSAIVDMNSCSAESNDGILAAGTCLGRVAVQTEMKASAFITQTGLEIARVNMALATLPAALDVCVGSQMVEAGLGTARVVMEVGSCSASGIFSIIRNPKL